MRLRPSYLWTHPTFWIGGRFTIVIPTIYIFDVNIYIYIYSPPLIYRLGRTWMLRKASSAGAFSYVMSPDRIIQDIAYQD
jgi:hypothetical protein